MISVIIPVFNIAEELPKCLDSLKQQTLAKSKFEVVIIDDDSTDDTFEVASSYSKKHPYIRCFQLPNNGGPGIARNKGLDESKGDYIVFLDGDDFLPKYALGELLLLASDKNADVVTYNWAYSNSYEDTNSYQPRRRDLNRFSDDKNELIKSFLSMCFDGSVIYTMAKKRIFYDNNIRFPGGYHEDIPVIFQIYYYAQCIYRESRVMYLKRNRPTSIVNTISRNHIDGYFNAWIVIKDFLVNKEKKDFSNDYLESYLKGVTGLIALSILKNIEINKQNTESRFEIYGYIYDLLQKHFFVDYSILGLPGQTKYDKISNCFIDAFSNKNERGSAEEIFEKEAQQLDLVSVQVL